MKERLNKMVHHNICPLCGSDKISIAFKCADHFISKELFTISECKSCNFLFTSQYPDEHDIGIYYESPDYISHSGTTKGLVNNLYHHARSFMLKRKKYIVKKVSGLKTGALLDIGSGTGHFAKVMMDANWNVKGIEINEKARDFSKTAFDLNVFSPSMISSFESGSFDCITLWHVLEHFHDPYKYASEILRLLKPEGSCVIALPNSSSYDAGHYKENWAASDVPRHLWHFSPDTFRIFCEKNGFNIKAIKTLPLDVFYISILSERYKGSSFSFIKGMIKAMFFAFFSLLNPQKNSSLIYVLEKSQDPHVLVAVKPAVPSCAVAELKG